MSLGGQTITVVTFSRSGAVDNLGIQPEIPVEVEVEGVHFRPLSATETAEISEIDIETQVWKLTADPVAAVLNADTTAYIRYNGDTFTVVGGAQPFTDLEGEIDHVTILVQKQVG